MSNLIDLVDSLANDIEGMKYAIDKGKIQDISIKIGGRWLQKKEIETLWNQGKPVLGVTPYKLHLLNSRLLAANAQGIYFDNEEPSRSFLYCKWGKIDFVYKIYTSKDAIKRDEESQKNDRSYIIFNDTIAFVRFGIYPSNGHFKDYEQFCHSTSSDYIYNN